MENPEGVGLGSGCAQRNANENSEPEEICKALEKNTTILSAELNVAFHGSV